MLKSLIITLICLSGLPALEAVGDVKPISNFTEYTKTRQYHSDLRNYNLEKVKASENRLRNIIAKKKAEEGTVAKTAEFYKTVEKELIEKGKKRQINKDEDDNQWELDLIDTYIDGIENL